MASVFAGTTSTHRAEADELRQVPSLAPLSSPVFSLLWSARRQRGLLTVTMARRTEPQPRYRHSEALWVGSRCRLATPPTHHAASDLNRDDDNGAAYHSDPDYHHYATTTGALRNLYRLRQGGRHERRRGDGNRPNNYWRNTRYRRQGNRCPVWTPNHALHLYNNNATASDDGEATMATATMVRRRRRRQSDRDDATTATRHCDTDDDNHSDNGNDDSKMVLRRNDSNSDDDDDTVQHGDSDDDDEGVGRAAGIAAAAGGVDI
ncbi:hypothetical protein EDB84DRAFT_1622830 [Lactarius hengduanensis]|nr:hypothetical protein EDB84DRAFT_1622830 [Lactarius hengduanensis]